MGKNEDKNDEGKDLLKVNSKNISTWKLLEKRYISIKEIVILKH